MRPLEKGNEMMRRQADFDKYDLYRWSDIVVYFNCGIFLHAHIRLQGRNRPSVFISAIFEQDPKILEETSKTVKPAPDVLPLLMTTEFMEANFAHQYSSREQQLIYGEIRANILKEIGIPDITGMPLGRI